MKMTKITTKITLSKTTKRYAIIETSSYLPLLFLLVCLTSTHAQQALRSNHHHTPSTTNTTTTTTLTNHRHLYENFSIKKPAMAALVPSNPNDIADFCLALKSLKNLRSLPSNVPFFAFNEGDLTSQQKVFLRECTHLPLSFPSVNFTSFPEGFNLKRESRFFHHTMMLGVHALKRKEWGYVQMVRFWTTLIWKHPRIASFDTIMRIDTDSCFTGPGGALDASLPFLQDRFVYRCPGVGRGANHMIDGLFDFTVEYMTDNDIEPKNPGLWEFVVHTWETYDTLPVFTTNFEVGRREFFVREEVMRWHEALTEREPFGVLRMRWGDAQTRVMTMAMFATEEDLSRHRHVEYRHGRGKCKEYFDSEATKI